MVDYYFFKKRDYVYYDSPDGEDILPKYMSLVRPLTATALLLSAGDVLLNSKPKGYMNTLGRFVHVSWPIYGSAAAFVIGSNLAGSIREKDDKWNWFIGGAAAGSVVGLWTKRPSRVFHLALLGGLLAFGKKYCDQNNRFFLIPDEKKPVFGGLRVARSDYSLMAERPRNWTTGAEE